jgi:hypothetical protein
LLTASVYDRQTRVVVTPDYLQVWKVIKNFNIAVSETVYYNLTLYFIRVLLKVNMRAEPATDVRDLTVSL